MRRKVRSALSIFLALAMVVLGLPEWIAANTAKAADVTYEKGSSPKDAVNLTGEFGFIAFESLRMFGHQHANVMTKEYIGEWESDRGNNSECTIRAYLRDVDSYDNYIQKIRYTDNPSYGAKFGYAPDRLIVGESHSVNKINDTQYQIDNVIVENSGTVLGETADWKYVDLANLQKSFREYSAHLAAMESADTDEIDPDLSDMNHLKVEVNKTDSGVAVWNVTAADLSNCDEHPLRIIFPSGSRAGLLINVDMAGESSFTLKETDVSLNGGGTYLVSDENLYGDSGNNRVYFNFYDSTAVDKQFRGTITTTNIIVGTILAPMAELNAPSGNLNGMFVADKISVKSESHRINPFNLPPAPKKDIDPEVTIEDWTYGEGASEPKLTSGSNPGNGSVTYEYKVKGADDSTYSTTVPEHAGEYTVRATIAETEDYYGGTCEADFTIEKADNPAVVTPEASVMRDGHGLDLSGYVANGIGTVTYEIDGDDNGCTIDGTTGELLSGEESGSVTVKVTFSGDDDYKPATEYIMVTITDKDILNASVSMDDWTYGETASDPVVDGNTVDAEEKIEYKESGAEDSTYTETKPDKPGDYTVRYTIEETETTEEAVATYDFTIDKGERQIAVSLDDWTYGETASEPQLSGDTDGAVVMYRKATEDDAAYTTEVPTEAGDYVVRASVEEDDYCKGCEDTAHFTINKAPIDPTVEVADWTYGEAANEPVITGNDGDGDVTVEYRKADSSDDWTTDVPSNAGDYEVRATIADTDNYYDGEAIGAFTINKAENTAVIDDTASVKKSGNTIGLSDNVTDPAGEVTYEIVGEANGCSVDPETGEFTSGSTPCDVTVRVTVAGDENHEPTEQTITVTVADKKPIDPTITLDDWVYGEDANAPEISGNDGDGNETVEYRKVGSDEWSETVPVEAGEYEVRVTIAESEDYNGGEATDTFTIEKAKNPATIDTETDNEVTKNTIPSDGHRLDLSTLVEGATGEVTYTIIDGSSGCSVDDNGIFVPDGQTGDATVKITVAGDDNHEDATATVIVTVVDKEEITPEVTIEGWMYGEDANEPGVTEETNPGGGAVTYQYKKKGADDSTYTDEVPTGAGEYTVRATVAETPEYKGGTGTADFTIEKAENTAEVDDTASVKKSGNIIELSDNVTEPAGEVTYEIIGEANGCTVDPETGSFTSGSTPCDVTVQVTVAGDDDHEPTTKTITVTVTDKEPINPAVTIEDWAYGDDANEPEISGNDGDGKVTVEYRKSGSNDDWSEEVPTEAGNYDLRVTIDESDDYNGGTATTDFTIKRAENPAKIDTASENKVTKNTVPEDGHSVDLSALVSDAEGEVSYEIVGEPEGCTINEDGVLTPGASTGTVTVKITVAGDDNHEDTTAMVTVAVVDKEAIEPEVTIEGWTYGDAANEPGVTADSNPGEGAVTYQYKKKGADDSTYTDEVPTEAGNYTVRATVAETPEYESGTAAADFTIERAENTAEVDDTASVKKSGNTIELSDNVTDPAGEVTYAIVGDANGCSVDPETGEFISGTTPGEVTVQVTVAGDKNHEPTTKTITVKVTDKETINPSVELEDWTYGDEANKPYIEGNDGDGDVTVEYRKADGSDEWSETVPTEAGEYEVRVTIAETEDYNGGEATDTFTIEKAENPAKIDAETDNEVTKNTIPSDGHSVDLSTLVEGATGDVTYEIIDGSSGCSVDENGIFVPDGQTGDATVKITVAGDNNHEDTTATVIVTVVDKEAIEPEVTIEGWTYGEDANEPGVTADSNPGEGSVTYQYKKKGADDSTYTDAVPTDAGNYTALATVAETPEYKSGSGTCDFTIEKADNTAVVDGSESVMKGNKTIDLSDNVTNPAGEVKYEIIGEANGCTVDPETGEFTSGTTTGEVTVQVTVAGDDNHEPATKTIKVTVTDKEPINPTVELDDWVYGDDAKEPEISGNDGDGKVTVEYRKADGSTEWSEEVPTEAGDYEVRVTIAETENYNSGSATTTFTIEKAENPATIDSESENEVTKNAVPADGHSLDLSELVEGAKGDVTYKITDGPEGCTIDKDGVLTPGATTGTVTVSITVAGDDNHEDTTATVTVTVVDKEAIKPEVMIEGWTFGEDANEPGVTADSNPGEGAVTYQYKKQGADDSTYTDEVPTGAGDYTVRATVAETADYKSGSGTCDFTIEKADNSLSVVEADHVKKGGNTLDLSEKIANPNGDVTYEIVGDAKGCTIDKTTGILTSGSQTGTVTVRVSASGDDDHKAGSETIEITIEDKLAIEPAVNLDDWSYGDDAKEPEISGNEGEGEVTVEYRKADGSDEWSEEVPTEAGEYEVRVTIAETDDYNGGEATDTFTIEKTEDPAVIDTETKTEVTVNTLDGDDHSVDLSELVEGAEGDVTYKIVDGPEGCEIDEDGNLTPGSETGTVTVEITIADSDNHTGKTETITVTVKDKEPIDPEVTIDDWTYGETEQKPEVSGNDGNGDVTYEYKKKGEDDSAYTTEVPTDAGEYIVRATVEETGEYAGGSDTAEFTIEKAKDPAVIDTAGTTVQVNTTETDDHSVELDKLVSGEYGDVTFELEDAPEGSRIEDGKFIPGSETGEAVIKVTITDSDNHTGKTAEIVIRITDKDTAEIKVSQDDSTYEEDLPDPKYDVPGDDDAKVTITYTGTLADGTPYEATGEKPTEAGNYVVTVEVETGDTVYTGKDAFTIEKAVPPIGTVTANDPHNTGDIAKVALSAGDANVKGTFALKETKLQSGTNEYHWTFTPDDTNNYKTVSGTVTITVTEHDWSEWEVVKKAKVAEDGLRKRTCTICGEVETEVIPKLGRTEEEKPEQKDPEPEKPEQKDPEPVKIVYTAPGEIKWTKDSGVSVEIKINRSEDGTKTASQIEAVEFDGTRLMEGKDYTILPDGTVKLSVEFMNKQSAGTHTITISFKDGDAVKTKLEVVVTQKVDADIESPKTGDLSGRTMFFWFLAALLAATLLLVERKRREEAEA